jgi:high-affinity iron transporter
MYLRTILNATIAFGIALFAAAVPAQESPAKRLASIAGVAVEEYAKGVDANGRIFAALEYEEATTFLADAREIADRVTDGRAADLGRLLDAMRAAVAAKVAPDSLFAIHTQLVAVLGPDAALDMPSVPVDLAAGRDIYRQRCASCHGESGMGDGFAAKGMEPPPPAFADAALMADVTPALMFRIVTVGIQGTAMTGFTDLTPAQRWNVVTYVNTLRDDATERERGAALLKARCARCADGAVPEGHSLAWLAERHDVQVLAALRSGAAAAR